MNTARQRSGWARMGRRRRTVAVALGGGGLITGIALAIVGAISIGGLVLSITSWCLLGILFTTPTDAKSR